MNSTPIPAICLPHAGLFIFTKSGTDATMQSAEQGPLCPGAISCPVMGGYHVGTHDNPYSLLQCHKTGVDKSNCHLTVVAEVTTESRLLFLPPPALQKRLAVDAPNLLHTVSSHSLRLVLIICMPLHKQARPQAGLIPILLPLFFSFCLRG